MKTTRHLIVALATLLFLGRASELRAEPILSQITGGSFTLLGSLFGMQPFDPDLGTLLSVNVTINGQMAGLSLLPGGLTIEQEFTGLGDQFFDFNSPAQFFFPGAAIDPQTGAFIPTPFGRPFTYTFTFNETTDLFGFLVPSFSGADVPPTSISALVSDFVEPVVPFNQMLVTHAPAAGGVGNFQVAGAVLFQYNYTPTPIPEPGTISLLGLGLGGLVLRRRKR